MLPSSAVLPSSETESIKGRLEVQIHMNKTTHIMKMGLIIKACINNTCLFSRKVFDGTEVPGKKKKPFIFLFSIVKKQPDFSAFNLNEMCWKFSTSYERNATVSQKHNVIAETKWRKLRSSDFGGSRSRTNIHLSIITFPQKVLTTGALPVHTIHTTTTVNLFKLRQSRSCHYVWLHQNRFVPPIIMVSRAFHI